MVLSELVGENGQESGHNPSIKKDFMKKLYIALALLFVSTVANLTADDMGLVRYIHDNKKYCNKD